MRKKIAAALALGISAAVLVAGSGEGLAQAQDPAQTVKARQDLMKSLFPNYYRGFNQVARGESTDIASIPAKARQASAAVRTMPALFPAGTGRDVVPTARAKPEIWSQRAEFEKTAATLAAETDKLGEIAQAGNLEAVKTQVAAVMKSCTGCHGGPAKSGGKFRFEAE